MAMTTATTASIGTRALLLALALALVAPGLAKNGHVSDPYPGLLPLASHRHARGRLPSHFDWRNVDGTNFVTADVNQHLPQYCGSCWVHGSVAQLNDRMKIIRRGAWPDAMVSRQAVVNCALNSDGVAPGCNGGEPWYVFGMMQNRTRTGQAGMPDESCQPYMARNMECSPVCTNCDPGTDTCFPVTSYVGYGVHSFWQVRGKRQVAREIYENGPVTCSFVSTEEFMYNYSTNAAANEGGVFIDDRKYPKSMVDHDIELAGWGVTDDGVEYWIGRNSWGTYWGENGWFKLKKGTLRMEEDCWAALPVFDDLEDYLSGKYLGSYDGLVQQEVQRDQRPKECHSHGAGAAF